MKMTYKQQINKLEEEEKNSEINILIMKDKSKI